MRLAYIIEWFDKNSEELVKYIEVPTVSKDDFRDIFGIINEIDFYGCAPIKTEYLAKLKKFTAEEFELEKYDYFMSLCSFKE